MFQNWRERLGLRFVEIKNNFLSQLKNWRQNPRPVTQQSLNDRMWSIYGDLSQD